MNKLKTLKDLFAFLKNTRLSGAQMKALQNQKLRTLLHFAWERSAFYRRTFEKAGITKEQLDSLPLAAFPTIDKQILMEHFDELITVPGLRQEDLRKFDAETRADRKPYLGKYHVVHSSGSTGKPGYFFYDEAAWHTMLLGILRGALWNMTMPQILKLLAGRPRILYIAATDGPVVFRPHHHREHQTARHQGPAGVRRCKDGGLRHRLPGVRLVRPQH